MKSIIYARVSSTEQSETGYSLPAQIKFLKDYAATKEYDVVKTFSVSESASGRKIRKTFHEMLQYARQHNVHIVLCEKIDRLTRNLKDASETQDWIIEHPDNQVHFVKEAFILNRNTKAHENLVWNMKVSIARFYTDNLSEEVKKGQKEKLAQGWIPTRAKLGYKTSGEKGHKIHVVDDTKAPLVRKMFELYASGNHSLKSLVKVMHAEGLRNNSGTMVAKSRMHELLSNPFYCGKIVWRDQLYDGQHEPLISRELFDEVQRKLDRKIAHPYYEKHLPVLKAKIHCAECGGTITWYTAKGHWYGNCNHYKKCSQKGCVRQEVVEEQLFPYFDQVAPIDPEVLDWLSEALKENHEKEIDYNTAKRDELTRIVKIADRRIEEAYRDKLDGKMPVELCEKIINESTEEKKNALESLGKLAESRQAYYEVGYAIHELAMRAKAIYQSPKATFDDKRLLLSYIFSNISLKAGIIDAKYTLAFEFLIKWIPIVNKNFEPQKPPIKSGASVVSQPISDPLLDCMRRFEGILWQIPDPFTPSNTPSIALSQFEGVANADCPVSLGLLGGRRTKPQVLLHSGLPSQLPRQSQLTTLTAIQPSERLAFLQNSDPRQYPEMGHQRGR